MIYIFVHYGSCGCYDFRIRGIHRCVGWYLFFADVHIIAHVEAQLRGEVQSTSICGDLDWSIPQISELDSMPSNIVTHDKVIYKRNLCALVAQQKSCFLCFLVTGKCGGSSQLIFDEIYNRCKIVRLSPWFICLLQVERDISKRWCEVDLAPLGGGWVAVVAVHAQRVDADTDGSVAPPPPPADPTRAPPRLHPGATDGPRTAADPRVDHRHAKSEATDIHTDKSADLDPDQQAENVTDPDLDPPAGNATNPDPDHCRLTECDETNSEDIAQDPNLHHRPERSSLPLSGSRDKMAMLGSAFLFFYSLLSTETCAFPVWKFLASLLIFSVWSKCPPTVFPCVPLCWFVFSGIAVKLLKMDILKTEWKCITIQRKIPLKGKPELFVNPNGARFKKAVKGNFYCFVFLLVRRRFEREKLGALGVPEVWTLSPTMEKLEWAFSSHHSAISDHQRSLLTRVLWFVVNEEDHWTLLSLWKHCISQLRKIGTGSVSVIGEHVQFLRFVGNLRISETQTSLFDYQFGPGVTRRRNRVRIRR